MICLYLNLYKRVTNESLFLTCFSEVSLGNKEYLQFTITPFFFYLSTSGYEKLYRIKFKLMLFKMWFLCQNICQYHHTWLYLQPYRKRSNVEETLFIFKCRVVVRSSLIVHNSYNAVFHNVIHYRERNTLIWSLL